MGQMYTRLGGKREVKMLMHGLDDAGKTTILHKLKLGEVVATIPTVGFIVENVVFKNIRITTWDVGGRGHNRPFWQYNFKNTDAYVLVIDSNDRGRLEAVKNQLTYDLENEEGFSNCVMAVVCNKQDLPDVASVQEISEFLEVEKIKEKFTCEIFGTSAITGEGLHDVFEWIAQGLEPKRSEKQMAADSKNNTNTVPKTSKIIGKLNRVKRMFLTL